MRALIIVAVVIGGSMWWKRMKLINSVRGLRNNNPLNIEKGADWEGLSDAQTDERFAQFKDPRYGYRAAARILNNYRKRGVDTLLEIVSTWAPENENDVASYAGHVAQASGVGLHDVVTEDDYPAIFAVMTKHENGVNPYSLEFIAEGVSWA